MAQGLLSGTVVLDLTRVLAGPYCGMLLADMGATVIKVEMIGKGDDSRAYGPFAGGESCYYMGLNRGKKGVTLNLKEDKGKKYVVRESSSSFYRSVQLPERAYTDAIEAHLEDGVLKVVVPVTPAPEPKKIAVKAKKK